MNKKLLSLAIAAAMTSGTALAQDITIYGKMHYSTDYIETNSAAVTDKEDWATGVGTGGRASNIGVKGSEDLGNGLKAIFKIESSVGGNVGSRNTYVGLSGDFGTLLMGQHDTPYKISTGSLDVFGDTLADYNGIIGKYYGSTRFDERAPQTVAYISPNMNGLTVAGALVSATLDEGAGNDETQAVSLAAMYSNGPMFASLAYEYFEDGLGALANPALVPTGPHGAGAQNSDAWKLGLGYKMDAFSVGFVWEEIDRSGANNSQDNWLINGSYAMGNNVIKAEYGESNPDGANNSSEMWAIGLDHNMSKRTKVYALYTDMQNDAGGAATLNCAGAAGSQCAADHSGVSFGMVHSF